MEEQGPMLRRESTTKILREGVLFEATTAFSGEPGSRARGTWIRHGGEPIRSDKRRRIALDVDLKTLPSNKSLLSETAVVMQEVN